MRRWVVMAVTVSVAALACTSATEPERLRDIPESFLSPNGAWLWGCDPDELSMREQYSFHLGELPPLGMGACLVLARLGENDVFVGNPPADTTTGALCFLQTWDFVETHERGKKIPGARITFAGGRVYTRYLGEIPVRDCGGFEVIQTVEVAPIP